MIDTLYINFTQGEITYTMNVPVESDNVAYNLADAVKELIRKSSASPNIIIEELKGEFGYDGEEIH